MEVSSLVGRELSKVAQEIEFFVNSAVANQKKLQYAVSQLRLFARAFNLRFPRLSPLTQKQIQAADGIVKNASKLKSIISQNMSNCWANSVISNSSSAVAAEVCEIIRRLNAEASILDPEDSHFFDPADPKWLQLHLFDLHSIHTSFKSFLEGENNSISSNIQTIIKSRLQSIDNFIKEYERESIVPPNIVFTPIPIHYKTWTLDVNDIIEEKQIGSGVSSNVFYGTLKSTKEKVAIKKFKYKLTGSRFRSFQREVTTLATTIHDTLLRFIGVTETPPYCIVTEWMPGGNLYNELHKRKKLTPTQLTIVAYDIARGMNFLHKHQIIHRDLKSLNVLLDDKGRAKICDFGSSKKFGKTEIMTVNVGTPYWMAPELLSGHQNYDTKVDVYSYGIVLWEILFHKTPYNGCDHLEVIHSVLDNDARPSFPGIWFPEELEDLINSCWERDPRNRPTFSTILKLFQTGKIYFPGTDISLFLQHVQETQSTDDKDSLQIQELLQRSDVTLEDFSYTINNSSIPNDYLEETWNKLETFQASPNLPLLSLCYSKFLTTGKAFQASERLRSFPRGQISKEIIVKFLSNVPTGNEELDENLLIISCKNNMTEEAEH
ncbi:TKL family protein kinase [Histomonas meleagridis]|nr:TKL family protein kinase [Histomonas meleagridis]